MGSVCCYSLALGPGKRVLQFVGIVVDKIAIFAKETNAQNICEI